MKLGSRPLRRFTYLITLAVALILVVVASSTLPSIAAPASAPLVWATKAPMPAARYSLGVVTGANGNIYAIGGWLNNAQSSVYEYNPASNTWATKASMSTARASAGVAESGGIIYVIGGVGGGVYTNTVESYNGTSWSPKASMSVSRDLLAAAASNGKIYAIGGRTSHSPTVLTSTVEEYDPATNAWTTKSPMPTARNYLVAATASNGKIYAIGGSNSSGTVLATVEEYNPATNTWTTKSPMSTARADAAAAAAPDGKIYVIGGHDGVNTLATVEAYDPATNTWTSATSMPTARSGLGAAVSNGKIYAIGGVGIGNVVLATVEEATGAGPAPTPTPVPPTPTPTPVPGVSTLGMLALSVLLIAAFFWARRRRLAD